MKHNQKLISLIAGSVFLALCLTVFLAACRRSENSPTDPTDSTQLTATETVESDSTQSTDATEAPEETTDPTEETTEPTEETTAGGSSTPGGTGGFTGGGTVDDDDTEGDEEEEEEELTVAAPGSAENPYAEAFDRELGSFVTVYMTAEQPVYYNVYSVRGAVMSVEGDDVYVVYNETTYQAQDGAVTLALEDDGTEAAVAMQIGTASTEEAAYTVSFAWPDGSEAKPYDAAVDQMPGSVTTGQIEAGAGLYYKISGIEGTSLTIEDADVQVVYGGVTYSAENGILTVDISKAPAIVCICNVGTAPKQFTLNFDYMSGTANKPYTLEMGEFTAELAAGNDQGVYYQYIAEADGVVTVQHLSAEISRQYLLLNTNTYDCRTLAADGVTDETTGITAVSIQVSRGDVLTLIAAAEPGEDGSYPEAQITTLTSFEAGATLPEDPAARLAYSFTVSDGYEAPMAGVQVSIRVGNLSVPLVTDAAGNASITLAAGTYQATLTVPEGYEAEATEYELNAEAPAAAIVVKQPEASELEYAVTVVDYNGIPQQGVMVQFLLDGNVIAMQSTDAAGMVKAVLPRGDYTFKLAFSAEGYYYDETLAVLTAKEPAKQIPVASGLGTEFQELYVGNAYYLSVGGTYVDGMQTNVTNYFLFEPTVSGTYRFTTSNPEAVISFCGGSTAFIQDLTASTDYADNAFTRNVKENNLGITFIIGVTGAPECVIEITRIGDAVLDETDIAAEIYEAKTPPAAFALTLGAGQSLTYVDVTAPTDTYNLVLGTDGYYHLNSADGPIMYVNLGPKAPYVSFYQMLGYTGYGGTSFTKAFRDENGLILRREDYTACMCQYVESVDAEGYGVYPMTEDLLYMLQQGGDHKGWWDSTNGNYLFGEVTGLNTEIAWMFACCYVQ